MHASWVMAALARTEVRDAIRQKLDGTNEPDPHVIAQQLLDEIGEDELRDLVLTGLVTLVREQVRADRPPRVAAPSRKWDKVKEAVRRSPEVFSLRFQTEAGWKLLGDFTKADAVWCSERYSRIADAATQRATCFDLLARRLPERGLVREFLKASDVEAIFNA